MSEIPDETIYRLLGRIERLEHPDRGFLSRMRPDRPLPAAFGTVLETLPPDWEERRAAWIYATAGLAASLTGRERSVLSPSFGVALSEAGLPESTVHSLLYAVGDAKGRFFVRIMRLLGRSVSSFSRLEAVRYMLGELDRRKIAEDYVRSKVWKKD